MRTYPKQEGTGVQKPPAMFMAPVIMLMKQLSMTAGGSKCEQDRQ
jgi:hypothetical protein